MSPHQGAGHAPHAHMPTATAGARRDDANILKGWRLEAARIVWLAAALINVVCFLAGLPRTFAIASTLSPATLARLEALGLPATFPAWYLIVLDTATFLLFASVATILFRRRAEDRMALVGSYMLLFTGMLYTAPGYEARVPVWLIAMGAAFAEYLQVAFLLVFPSGRFWPAWTRYLLWPLAVWRVLVWYFAYIPWLYASERTGDAYPFLQQDPLDLLLLFAVVLFAIGLQIRRYRRESDPEERLQAKWLVWGSSIAVVLVGSYVIVTNVVPALQPIEGSAVLMRLVGRTVRQMALGIIPVAILYSILRYRLWDVDLLINRTLVYVPLTSILAGIYTVTITLTQRFFVATTGQRSDVAIVLTTLLMTALVTPVRSELQGIVDRRLKDVPDPFKRLKAFDEQMEVVANVLDHERLLKRLLDDTIRAFGAEGGAVYMEDGAPAATGPRLVKATEGWKNNPAIRLPLDCQGICTGWLELGPRASGAPYSEEERKRLRLSLERVADVILLVHAVRGGPMPGVPYVRAEEQEAAPEVGAEVREEAPLPAAA